MIDEVKTRTTLAFELVTSASALRSLAIRTANPETAVAALKAEACALRAGGALLAQAARIVDEYLAAESAAP